MKTIVVAAVLALTITGEYVVTAQETTTCATPSPSAVQHFSAENASVTEPFTLIKGVYVVSGTYKGDSNFMVYTLDEMGNEELVLNALGPFEGKGSLTVNKDTRVVFDVRIANGPWTLDIEPAF